jgi:hypothetical protein
MHTMSKVAVGYAATAAASLVLGELVLSAAAGAGLLLALGVASRSPRRNAPSAAGARHIVHNLDVRPDPRGLRWPVSASDHRGETVVLHQTLVRCLFEDEQFGRERTTPLTVVPDPCEGPHLEHLSPTEDVVATNGVELPQRTPGSHLCALVA